MPTLKVKVKWGKETFKDVEANTDEDILVFKAQLFALTGVHPDRQKIVCKGINMKDWSSTALKDGAMLLLMGSKEEDVPKVPVEKTVFMEDMTESELANALDLPVGLTNVGNTCYMNAVVQCLKTVPELRQALTSYAGDLLLGGSDSSQAITAALRDLYNSMDRSGQEVLPVVLLRTLHVAFPRFAEKGPQGSFQQQDANECWTELLRMLQLQLKPVHAPGENAIKFSSFIDQYLGGTFISEMKCVETEDEPATTVTENFLQLSCFISQDVKYALSGLKSKLEEQITKNSPLLGRDAVYSKKSRISRLPAYLCVQFVRFQYKGSAAINAKILKDVKFPVDLDVYELCTEQLQEKLVPMRDRFKELEDKLVEQKLSLKDSSGKVVETKDEPCSFPDDLGSNNSGYYTLQAVLTHKGRSSSSGHYVAWVKFTNDSWLKCDDETVTPVTQDEVLKLSGGGDWHTAYVLLYGPRILRLPITQ